MFQIRKNVLNPKSQNVLNPKKKLVQSGLRKKKQNPRICSKFENQEHFKMVPVRKNVLNPV